MNTVLNVYLAGPMRGRREFNFPLFFRAASDLTRAGLRVFNPAEQDDARGFPWHGTTGWEDLDGLGLDLRQAMGDDVAYIASSADAVVTLPGWEDSAGSRAEVALALSLDLLVWEYDEYAHRVDREVRPGYFYNDGDTIPLIPYRVLDPIREEAESIPAWVADTIRETVPELAEMVVESNVAGREALDTLLEMGTEPLGDFAQEDDAEPEPESVPESVEVRTWAGDVIRRFASGATRDSNDGKFEYARFFDPRVLEARAAYMHKNRVLPDGSLRDPDNWKQGIPVRAYMDGLMRHLIDVWLIHDYGEATRPETGADVDLVDALCAIMFNAEGWLHALLTADQEVAA